MAKRDVPLGSLVGRPVERLVDLALIVQRHAGLDRRAGDPVEHADLVLEDHQRDDVAMGRRVHGGREPVLEIDQVHSLRIVEVLRLLPLLADQVAQVLLRAARAGHIPPPPALFEGAAVIGPEGPIR